MPPWSFPEVIKYPKGVSTHATEAFEVVHSDVCGPMPVLVLTEGPNILSLLLMITQDTHLFILLNTSMKC